MMPVPTTITSYLKTESLESDETRRGCQSEARDISAGYYREAMGAIVQGKSCLDSSRWSSIFLVTVTVTERKINSITRITAGSQSQARPTT